VFDSLDTVAIKGRSRANVPDGTIVRSCTGRTIALSLTPTTHYDGYADCNIAFGVPIVMVVTFMGINLSPRILTIVFNAPNILGMLVRAFVGIERDGSTAPAVAKKRAVLFRTQVPSLRLVRPQSEVARTASWRIGRRRFAQKL
jgi:hypothetical protein